MVIRIQYTGHLYGRQLNCDCGGDARSDQMLESATGWCYKRERRHYADGSIVYGLEGTAPQTLEATPGVQSTPEILGINVKSCTWVGTRDDLHISDHQPNPSSPRTFTAITFATLLTPLKSGQLPTNDRKFSMHSLGGRCNGTGAVRAVSMITSAHHESSVPVAIGIPDVSRSRLHSDPDIHLGAEAPLVGNRAK